MTSRLPSWLTFLLLSALLLLPACGQLQLSGPSDPELVRLLELVNDARAAGATCGGTVMAPAQPLVWNALLGRAAQYHSEDMAAGGNMTHVTPDGAIHYAPGTTFTERIRAEGYSYRSAGENIAWGFGSADRVMAAWLASSGHCRNLMNASHSEIGLGREGSYWTQVFASPAE